MPKAASASGSVEVPKVVRLKPSATNANLENGMLVSDTVAVVLIVGREVPEGDKASGARPQPRPKVTAVLIVPILTRCHSQVSLRLVPPTRLVPPNSTVRPR